MGKISGNILLFVWDMIAVWGTIALANWAAGRDLSGFVKSGIGIVCGLVGEGVRVGVIWLFFKLFFDGILPTDSGRIFEALLTLRILNIPVLVGFGMMAAGAAYKGKTVKCPKCNQFFALNLDQMKEKVGGAKELKEPCPHCSTPLVYDGDTFEVLRHEPEKRSETATRAGSAS